MVGKTGAKQGNTNTTNQTNAEQNPKLQNQTKPNQNLGAGTIKREFHEGFCLIFFFFCGENGLLLAQGALVVFVGPLVWG